MCDKNLDIVVSRSNVHALLDRWESGDVDEVFVQRRAEYMREMMKPDELSGFEEGTAGSIPEAVLVVLEDMHIELVVPEDIPAMRKFLDTPLGEEVQGWSEWNKYWDAVDHDVRRKQLKGSTFYWTHRLFGGPDSE